MDIVSPSGTAAAGPAELLALADRLRDAREWGEAAAAYAAYLRLRPEDWPIWVQYGHCVKEDGDAAGALLLYREAERLQPGDADLHVQIGHALKLLGRLEEAFQEYARALTLDPDCAPARAELLAPPPSPVPPPTAPSPPPARLAAPPPLSGRAPAAGRADRVGTVPGTLFFDASDLLDYFRHNRAPTGIQRVQINLIAAVLERAPEAAVVGFDPSGAGWKRLPAELFRRLVGLSASGAAVEDPDWAGAVATAVARMLQSPPLAFPAGSRLINLGTSWWLPDYLRRVREAKARQGLRYIPFLHDCIPLVVPERCAAPLVDEFARWFSGVCLTADAVLCNSACTEEDFRRHLGRLLPGCAIPTAVLRLDAAAPPAAAASAEAPPPPLHGGRPYVLFVGTLEARKNHLLVFNAWLTLLRRHGAAAVPDLICVGKRGWLAEEAQALHANSAALRERVHLLHGVSDQALAALYRGCLFTVYNSYYEGWGLPVTESLAHGKVPLVPAHSALRESGGEGAVYFEPQSEPDLVAKLERLMWDASFRAAQEARIASAVRLRSWEEVAAEMLGLVAPERLPALPAPLARAGLRLGTVHEMRLLPGPEPSLAMALADALREGPAWSALEPWGVWTLPGVARLRLPVPPGTEGPLRVHLDLLGPPQGLRFGLRPDLPGHPPVAPREIEIGPGERLLCTLDLAEAGGGEAAVEITCPAGVPQGVGLRGVMACRPDDVLARLDWLERAALPRLERLMPA
jgi:glycosyltransferase involved in cell wall biosynthesis